MDGYFITNGSGDSEKLACCVIAFVFVFIIMIAAILFTNCEKFEGFTDNIKYSNENVKNFLNGGFHYKAIGPKDDILGNFKSLDKNGNVALVAVLAPWCGYCKRLKESGELTKVSKKFPVIVLDDKHPQVNNVMNLLQAEGFPAIGIYYQGQLLPYRGDRTSKFILEAMVAIKDNSSIDSETPIGGRENFSEQKVINVPKNVTKREYEAMLGQFVSKGGKVCTIFMAPWCGHCKNLKSSGIIENLVGSDIKVILADDETQLAQDMSIQGFPTIYCANQRGNIKYEGQRETSEILSFLRK